MRFVWWCSWEMKLRSSKSHTTTCRRRLMNWRWDDWTRYLVVATQVTWSSCEKINYFTDWVILSCYFFFNELCIKWLLFWSFVGWEKWTTRWETKAKSRERQARAASEGLEQSTWIFTTPSCNAFPFSSPTSSLCKQNDAISWLPWNPYVAVCASCCSWYLRRSCSPPPCCLNYGDFALPELCKCLFPMSTILLMFADIWFS